MRVLFDIAHPAHVNFFKRLVYRLRDEGHDVHLVCLRRGKVPRIAAEEFPDFTITPVGTHARTRLGLYLRTGLLREVQLARVLRRIRPDVVVGVAAFQAAMLGRWLGFRSLGVSDDPEHTMVFKLSRKYLDRFLLPECLGMSAPNIVTWRGLKEWAYLSPRHFRPDESVPAEHGLAARGYIFIRDVETVSLNYRSQVENNILRLYEAGLRKQQVVLSLENKALAGRFADWHILQEPVRDIHSLIYFSRLAISSGDSMAREAAELGVESFYCGRRVMRSNQALIDLGMLRHEMDIEAILAAVEAEPPADIEARQRDRRAKLLALWEDPTEAMYRNLMELGGDLGRPQG